jgi:hypothetical protein
MKSARLLPGNTNAERMDKAALKIFTVSEEACLPD